MTKELHLGSANKCIHQIFSTENVPLKIFNIFSSKHSTTNIMPFFWYLPFLALFGDRDPHLDLVMALRDFFPTLTLSQTNWDLFTKTVR